MRHSSGGFVPMKNRLSCRHQLIDPQQDFLNSILRDMQAVIACLCFAALVWSASKVVSAGPREQVAVAEAIVWANQNAEPQLVPDSFNAAPPQGDSLDAAIREESAEIDEFLIENSKRIKSLESELAEAKSKFAANQSGGEWVEFLDPPRISITEDRAPLFRVPCIVYTADWCLPCRQQKRENGKGDIHVEFLYTTDPQPIEYDGNGRLIDTLPCTTFTDASGVLRTIRGFHTTDQIWEKIQRNNPPIANSVPTTATAGSIHASSQIRQLFAWWRSNIGEGIKASASWDRTGAQTFPLLAKGDWSAIALFGRSGRMELSAPGSKGLPVESIGFGYRVINDDISIDFDPVLLKGLASRLGPSVSHGQQSVRSSPVPSAIGPGTAWTILSLVRGIWSLLHPVADLQLGGNVSATSILNGDTLAIDFQQMPSIKIVALFTFNLAVKRLEISEQSIRVMFSGSSMIKERTFKVE